VRRRSEKRVRTLPQMAASPYSVRMCGKTYTMSPLDDRDWGELELWMQMRPIALAKEAIRRNPDFDENVRKIIYDKAVSEMGEIAIATPKGAAMLVSLDGVTMMTWIGVRRTHPDLTYEVVRKMMLDPQNVQSAMDGFDAANQNGPMRNPTTAPTTMTPSGASTDTPKTEPKSTSSSQAGTPGPAPTSSPI
jgi:hypothetical protein